MAGLIIGGSALEAVPTVVEPDYNIVSSQALEASSPIVQTYHATPAKDLPPPEIELKTEQDAKDYAIEMAVKYKLNPKLVLSIISCEGGFKDRFIKNPMSSAEGPWQFVNKTWWHTMSLMGLPTNTSKYDMKINLEAGAFLLAKEGAGHWSESEWCWKKKMQSHASP